MKFEELEINWRFLVSLVILLVIVCYFIASLYLSILKDKGERTVVQYRYWVTQVLDYYVNHQRQWPKTLLESTNSEDEYLDNICSPLNSAVETKACGDLSPYKLLVPSANKRYVEIGVLLRDQYTAKRLSSIIPMSYFEETDKGYDFRVVVAPPSEVFNRTALEVKQVFSEDINGKHGTTVRKPRCHRGWSPEYFVVQRWWFNDAISDGAKWPQSAIGLEGVSVDKDMLAPWTVSITTNNWNWPEATRRGRVTIVTYCKPPALNGRPYDPTYDYYKNGGRQS